MQSMSPFLIISLHFLSFLYMPDHASIMGSGDGVPLVVEEVPQRTSCSCGIKWA